MFTCLLSKASALCSRLWESKDYMECPAQCWGLPPELLGHHQVGGRSKKCERETLKWMQCSWSDDQERDPNMPPTPINHCQGWQLPNWRKKEHQEQSQFNILISDWWYTRSFFLPVCLADPSTTTRARTTGVVQEALLLLGATNVMATIHLTRSSGYLLVAMPSPCIFSQP